MTKYDNIIINCRKVEVEWAFWVERYRKFMIYRDININMNIR